jgi:methylated-DNA-[protein]-cysteine S-methyltransferase
LTALHLPAPSWQGLIQPSWRHDAAALQEVCAQLRAYFARELFAFELTVAITGTAFQRAVWRELNAIGYGQTASYRDIAVAVGRPRAVRAVGGANHVNPVPIIIPCHRVVGANGSLTGYGGGLDCKLALLELEQPERAAVSRATSS